MICTSSGTFIRRNILTQDEEKNNGKLEVAQRSSLFPTAISPAALREAFDFEEMPGEPVHTHYLWGNPALACACLLGQGFSESGWELRPGIVQEIGGLPIHVYRSGDERKATPCAEVVLTERAAGAILERGVMPLLSFKGRDTIRLARFQSLAEPPTRLAGRWGGD